MVLSKIVTSRKSRAHEIAHLGLDTRVPWKIEGEIYRIFVDCNKNKRVNLLLVLKCKRCLSDYFRQFENGRIAYIYNRIVDSAFSETR